MRKPVSFAEAHRRLVFLGYKDMAGQRTPEEDLEAKILCEMLYPGEPKSLHDTAVEDADASTQDR